MDIRFFDTLESTNNYCKLLDLTQVEEFTVICARNQTAGIGQQGNVWVSEPYKNLTFSLILKPTFLPASDQYQLTIAISVAVAETVSQLLPNHRTYIKWPNDIYVGDRKICGTLTINQLTGNEISSAICGIGLNVNQTVFPQWVPNPTSLKLLTCKDYDIEELLSLLTCNIEKCYLELHHDARNLHAKYMERLYRLGTMARYNYKGADINATITGINAFGQLQLLTDQNQAISCSIKEITFLQH